MINVFQYWGQGLNNLPPFLKIIYKHNMKLYKKYNINYFFIDDNNVHKYIFVPQVFYKLAYNFKSDIVRYYILHKYGGFWFDNDIIIMKDLSILYKKCSKYECMLDVENYRNEIGCASLFLKQNSVASNFCVNYVNFALKHVKLLWGEIGPQTVTKLYEKHSNLILLNNYEITKKGCNFISWNDEPGINKEKWFLLSSDEAQKKAKKLKENTNMFYIITWTMYRLHDMKEHICTTVFLDPKSVFYHLLNTEKTKENNLKLYKTGDKKYLLCIISCQKNFHMKEIIKKYWLNDLVNNSDIDYFFIYGYENIENTKIYKDEIHLKCKDTYNELNEKMCTLWKYLLNDHTKSYDVYIKTDDDNYINNFKFCKALLCTTELSSYGIFNDIKTTGKWGNLNTGNWNGPHWEGALYWFSDDILKHYCQNINTEHLKQCQLEDKLFCDIIRDISPIKIYEKDDDICMYGWPHYKNYKCF